MRYFDMDLDDKMKHYNEWNRKGVELNFRLALAVPKHIERIWTAKVHDLYLEISLVEHRDEMKNFYYLIDAHPICFNLQNDSRNFILLNDFENMKPLKSYAIAESVALEFIQFYAKRYFCIYHPAELFLIETNP